MTLMEKQDLMTANPIRFTYRGAFGANCCLCCPFGVPGSASQCRSPAPPHPVSARLNLGLLRSKSSNPLAGEIQEMRRGRSTCRPGCLQPELFHELYDSQANTCRWARPLLPSHFPFVFRDEPAWGRLKVSSQIHRFREGSALRRRTGESCFSGCVRAAHGLNVSFVVLSVKACV